MEVINCIACDTEISLKQSPKMGMLVTCASCGAELEVVWLDPLEVDWPFIDDSDEDEYEGIYKYDEEY
jgi:alpha-aminoadipate carrier protein LysW